MPFMARPVKDERDALTAYVAQQQDAFPSVIFGLTDEEAGLTPTASSLSVGALVKHVTFVQEGWLQQVLTAPDPVPPRGPEMYARRMETLTWSSTDTVAAVIEAHEAMSQRVLEAIRTVRLDLPVPVPPAPWNPRDVGSWSVRWVWLHLVEELARHAGHADIIRESIDGATTYELIAAREGVAETSWLKPWRAR